MEIAKFPKSIGLENIKKVLFLILTVVAIALLWQWLVSYLKIPSYVLPRPSQILISLVSNWDLIQTNTLVTLHEIVLSYGLAVNNNI
jgi:NitT/TauT family transport system permease protein